MKICFFMNTPFTFGGEQRVTTEIANYLCEKNIDVTFLLLDRTAFVDREKYGLNEKIKVKFVKEYGSSKLIVKRQLSKLINKINYKTNIFSKKINVLKYIYLNKKEKKILINEINKYNFDYIIGVGLRYTVILSLLKDELKNVKIIGWQHSTYNAYFETKNMRMYNSKKLAKFMFENLDGYVVQTNDDKEMIRKKFCYNAIVINNPNSNLSIKNQAQRKENIFMSAGRFVKIKNYDKIIYSYWQFINKNNDKDWKLLLIGDGPERKKCKKLVKKLGIEKKVVFTGMVKNIEEYYAKSKVYVCASDYEGWGMAITEAMMFNNLVITFNFPSAREIFGNIDCGIILSENTTKNLTEAMTILSKKIDIDDFDMKSQNARKRVEKFNIKTIGEKWIDFLNGRV